MSLIGLMCTRGDTFSLQVLIGRGLILLCRFVSFSLFNFESTPLFSSVGVYCDEGPPVPIPNTEVKLIHVDDTWLVTARETKSVPTQSSSISLLMELF